MPLLSWELQDRDFQGKNYHMQNMALPATPGSPRWPSPGLEINQPKLRELFGC